MKGLFSRKKSKKDDHGGFEIGMPTNVVRHLHVSKNQLGELEGLPKTWVKIMNLQITQKEQDENPDAAYQAVKFYNYSIKKKENAEPFKPFVTEEAIFEESEEIDRFLGHKSQDSFTGSSEDSSEATPEVPEVIPGLVRPPLPPPIPKKTNTLPPKPQLYPKPNIVNKKLHNAMEDLRFPDRTTYDLDNNNLNHNHSKSTIITKNPHGKTIYLFCKLNKHKSVEKAKIHLMLSNYFGNLIKLRGFVCTVEKNIDLGYYKSNFNLLLFI